MTDCIKELEDKNKELQEQVDELYWAYQDIAKLWYQEYKENKLYIDNKPYTFDEIKLGMWVWYNLPKRVSKGYYCIKEIDKDSKRFVLYRDSIGVVLDVYYSDNAFYPRQVH